MDQRSTILILRIVACGVIVAAIAAFIAQLRSIPDLSGIAIVSPLGGLALGVPDAAFGTVILSGGGEG